MQAELPRNIKKGNSQVRYFHYFVIQHDHRLFMKKRVNKDIWLGLYDFPLIESDQKKLDFEKHELTRNLVNRNPCHKIRSFKHVLSHQLIFASFYHWQLNSPANDITGLLPQNGKFYSQEEIDKIPKPVLINKYLKEE
jgi:A/G-specific adenine glycosylase